MPSLSPRPPSPRHRGVCVRCSQPPGKGTARVWLSQRGFGRRGWRTRVRRSASPETATGPTETPASCRSVAEVSFANGGFVARTRFGVFGQAMSRYGSRTLRRGFFVVDRNICNFLWYGGVVRGVVGEGLRSVGVVPILQPGACALSCPSLAVYRAGAFGLRLLYCPWSRCFSLHYQGNAAYALRPLCVARDLGWCECNYPRWGGHTSESTVTTLPVLGAPTSIMGRSSHGGYVTGLRPFALPRS